MVPSGGTLGAQNSVVHTENMLVVMETLVDRVLENTTMLCALGDQKQDVGGKTEEAPVVVEVVDEGTHQDVTCGTIGSALEKAVYTDAKFLVENDPVLGVSSA